MGGSKGPTSRDVDCPRDWCRAKAGQHCRLKEPRADGGSTVAYTAHPERIERARQLARKLAKSGASFVKPPRPKPPPPPPMPSKPEPPLDPKPFVCSHCRALEVTESLRQSGWIVVVLPDYYNGVRPFCSLQCAVTHLTAVLQHAGRTTAEVERAPQTDAVPVRPDVVDVGRPEPVPVPETRPVTTFVASKYDPTNDPHMPKPGEVIPDGRVVAKAEFVEGKKLVRMLMAEEWPDADGHEEVIVKDHPDRPFVKYFVWVNSP